MEKYYTKKLKIILHSKIFWGLWIVFIFLYIFIFLQQPFLEAKEEAISFEGKIVEYIWDFQSKKIKLTLKKGSKKELIFYNYQEGEEETLKEVIQYGNLIKGNGKKIIPSKNTIPNTFNYQKYLKSIGYDYYIVSNKIECFKSGSIHEKIHESFRDYLEKKKESVYYKTLLLGIKENWSKKREQIFRENGISHLFVISGLHLGFLFGIVQQILKKFFRIKKIPILCSFFFLSLYYSFLTKSVSSERAYNFFFLLTLNELTNLNLKSKQIYLLNIGMQLLKNPFLFFNIGFQYSVCLSFTFLFFPLKEKSKWKRILKNSFLAFFVSFPITLNQSFMINPWSILINLIMIPFLSGILFPVLLFSFVIPYLLNGVSFLFTIMEWCNVLFCQLPFSHINVAKMPNYLFWSYYFCFFLTIYLKQKKILFFWFFLWSIFLFAPKFDSTGYFYFIDVGQGDCTLIISPYQKEVLLVDTGNESESLKNNLILFLKSLGIQKINYLILTHGGV